MDSELKSNYLPKLGEQLTATTIYCEANADVEHLTHKMSLFLFKITFPFFVFPGLLQSYFQYFVLDLGEASFVMVFPAW